MGGAPGSLGIVMDGVVGATVAVPAQEAVAKTSQGVAARQ